MDCWATKSINKPKRRSCTVCICFIARHQPVSHQSVKPNSARGEPHAATCTCVKVLNITEWQKVSDKLLRLLHLCHILLPSYFTCYTVYFFWSRLYLSLSVTPSLSAAWLLFFPPVSPCLCEAGVLWLEDQRASERWSPCEPGCVGGGGEKVYTFIFSLPSHCYRRELLSLPQTNITASTIQLHVLSISCAPKGWVKSLF